MNNQDNGIVVEGKFWDINIALSVSQAGTTLGDQQAIVGKKVKGIKICTLPADERNNTLTTTGFFLKLMRQSKNEMTISADFLQPNMSTFYAINDSTIVWNKSEIIFPTAAARFVKLFVIYED
jgi:hypothetical protein